MSASKPASCTLLVDDDQTFLRTLAASLRKRGVEVLTAETTATAMRLQQQHDPASAVVDLKLGNESGLQVVTQLYSYNPSMKILVLTGYASIATAVHAIRCGASDYLCKPANTVQILAALGESNQQCPQIPRQRTSVDQLEWEYLQNVLLEHGGNISAAARSLDMHRRTLQRKLNKRSGSR